jgi:RNA polymerase sigma factor (sigma-70 family)
MSAPKDLPELAQRFDRDRRHLRSVAFQLLGSSADADDAVQSAWLKASRSDFDFIEDIANLTSWFTTITAHTAFDELRARKRRAEQPLTDLGELDRLARTASPPADEDALLADSVGRALLEVLGRDDVHPRIPALRPPRSQRLLADCRITRLLGVAGDDAAIPAKRVASGVARAAIVPRLAGESGNPRGPQASWLPFVG